VIESVIGWIGPLFQGVLGYAIVGTAVFLERSILVGLVVPGEVVLAIGGIFASRGDLTLWVVILVGALAGVSGESTGFWVGRRFGRSILRKIPFLRKLDERMDEVDELFDRHGGKAVAIGRYAVGAGALVPIVAGMGRMPYRKFLLFDVPAATVWAVGVGLVGYFLGANLGLVDKVLSRFGLVMLGLVAVLLGAWILWKRHRRAG
jgi:membrane-associated protein